MSEHPITITPAPGRVRVHIHGELIADTTAALDLAEADYPVVHYIPFGDVAADRLIGSDTTSYCPYKGAAGYYHVRTATGTVDDAIWTYPQPYPGVAAIAGHIAFYPDKAEITVESG